jgi:hypothetical protein
MAGMFEREREGERETLFSLQWWSNWLEKNELPIGAKGKEVTAAKAIALVIQ